MPKYLRLPKPVEAVRLTRDAIVYTERGQIGADAGDWLITNVADEQYPISHELFLKLYAPIDEEAEKYTERVKGWEFDDDRGVMRNERNA